MNADLPVRTGRPGRPGRLAPLLLASLPALLSGCLGPSADDEVDPERQLELYVTTATYLYDDGSYVRAQDQAVKALELEPENRPMRRMIGWIRLRLGGNADLIYAERFFRDLYDEGDRNQGTVHGLALALERLGAAYDRTSRAIASGEREPLAGPEAAEAEARRLASLARDMWHEARGLHEGTLQATEGNTDAMNGLQRLHALLGNYDESLAWSERLLERSRGELEFWQTQLQREEITRSEEQSFRDSERGAVELQTETHLFAATLLHRLGRHAEAIEHLNGVAAARPQMPEAYSLRGQLRAKLGEYQLAIEDLDRFLRLSDDPYEHPDVERAFDLRAECEKELERLARGR